MSTQNNLSGWRFLILDGNGNIDAQGRVLGHIGENTVVQFLGKPTFSRVYTPAQLVPLTLFPTEQAVEQFLVDIRPPAPAPTALDDNPEGGEIEVCETEAEFDDDGAVEGSRPG